MHDDELRAAGPPHLSPERHTALRSQLLTEIAGAARGPAPTSRRRRRAGAALIATVAVVTTATAAAAAVGWLRPDPTETAVVVDRAADRVDAHHPGWRPELAAERVQCATTATEREPAFEAYAADFPLGDAITPDDVRRACSEKAPTLDEPVAAEPTLCSDPAPALPQVRVVLDATPCSAGDFEVLTDRTMGQLNEARRMEVALLATPQSCSTRSEAEAWVAATIERDDMPLQLTPPPSTTTVPSDSSDDGACYRGWVSWDTATVTVDAFQLPN